MFPPERLGIVVPLSSLCVATGLRGQGVKVGLSLRESFHSGGRFTRTTVDPPGGCFTLTPIIKAPPPREHAVLTAKLHRKYTVARFSTFSESQLNAVFEMTA